ncbi:MAG: G5 domain-containing protein [Oscillospiraceae bacterium]|nr:G5 domain-containing protein [Oscillospiraceae bacterium]
MFERSKKAAPGKKRLIAVAAVPTLLFLVVSLICFSSRDTAYALYVISDSALVRVDELEGDVFLTDGSASLVSRTTGNDLALTAGSQVTVHHHEESFSTVAGNETITQLLDRLGVQPSPLEMTSVAYLDGALEIRVDSEFVFYEHISTISEHEIIYQTNSKKPAWQETVLQEGHDGEYTEVYEVIYQDGRQTARQLIEVVDVEPVSTIIERGAVENFANNGDPVSSIVTAADGTGTITLENGEVLTFSEARTMRGTAYTSGGKIGSRTASGTPVQVGVVAVDRNVLPLGTKMYVVSKDGKYVYGFAVAEDTGVRGNTIDLYMNTNSECLQFGVRDCTVYILD